MTHVPAEAVKNIKNAVVPCNLKYMKRKDEKLATVNNDSLNNTNKELIALISREGFELDWQETEEQIDNKQILLQEKLFEGFQEDKYKSLVESEYEEIEYILHNAPYMNGMEYLNHEWIEKIWNVLNAAFSIEIMTYRGNVADFLTSQSPDIHPVGRIFFHQQSCRLLDGKEYRGNTGLPL